jgi:hypothetical protein
MADGDGVAAGGSKEKFVKKTDSGNKKKPVTRTGFDVWSPQAGLNC